MTQIVTKNSGQSRLQDTCSPLWDEAATNASAEQLDLLQ